MRGLGAARLAVFVAAALLLGCAAARTAGAAPDLETARAACLAEGGGFVLRPDGVRIFYRRWPAAAAPRAVLVVVHGIGFDAGPYRKIADALGPRGVEVFALDLRGHGLSDGRRGLLAPVDDLAADVAAVLARVREAAPGVPVFLFGDSLGGLVALAAAARPDADLAGLVLQSPALSAHPSQVIGPQLVLAGLAGVLAPDHPTIPLTDFLAAGSRDPEFFRIRREDPLAQARVSARYLARFALDSARWRTHAPSIRTPVLVLQAGYDRIVRTPPMRELLALAPSADETLRAYPEAYHTLLWDPRTPEVLRDVGDWLLARAPEAAARR